MPIPYPPPPPQQLSAPMPFRSGTVSNRDAVSSVGPEHDRLRPQPYFSSAHGSVYYSPRRPAERRRRATSRTFPAPLIAPRHRRPHSIHVVSYPAGFVPPELRPGAGELQASDRNLTELEKRERNKRRKREAKERERKEKERKKAEEERSEKQERRRSLRSLSPGCEKVSRVIGRVLAAFSIGPKSPTRGPTDWTAQSRPSSFISFARRLSRFEPTTAADPIFVEPAAALHPMADNPIPTAVVPAGRNSMMSIRSAKTMLTSSVSEVQKPLASASGLSCTILMAEPDVFLTGFEHDHQSRRGCHTTSALLRGKLQLNVSKNVKIKSVTLKLVGKARTEWPEGIPPLKTETYEEQTLRAQSLVFFHAMHVGMWDTEYGNQCTYTLRDARPGTALHDSGSSGSLHILGKGRNSTLTAKEYKRLSLQSVNSRSFGKGDSPLISQVQAKGYKVFRPGTYEYAFELPIDHNQLETAKLQYGSVRWNLETTVERSGAFKPNLHGTKEVSIVRLPDQMSLETVEPISISRHWEDQLHYDIVISGKSFPIGGRIPIAFKLTPLAKVQIHKLKVFATESIEYWTNDRRVTRKDAGRKILLMEKTAGKPLDARFNSSDMRVLSGGELDPDQRTEARRAASVRRMREAWVRGGVEPLPEPTDNLLGDLDLGLEAYWGSTEIEMNVQLPTCEMMARDKTLKLHPDCSWKNINVFHWIKIVMRISRADPDDPAGKRRRHFEISIDSPITILNCRATQANTALPQYSGSGRPIPEQRQQMSCGCPDAQPLDPSIAGLSRPLTLVEEDFGRLLRLDRSVPSGQPRAPQAAHIPAARSGPRPSFGEGARPETCPDPAEPERPIHLIRHPSHNPPAFDADDPPPPPPLQTPPPNYDIIVGTPSVDGLADYFARLAEYEGSAQRELDQTDSDNESDTNTIGPGTEQDPDAADTGPSPAHLAHPSASLADVDPFNSLSVLTPGSRQDSGIVVDDNGHDHHEHADDDTSSSTSDSGDEDGTARPHRRGRVNVPNPWTPGPGGRLVPSRSLDIERPTVRLDMTGVPRRGGRSEFSGSSSLWRRRTGR